MKFFKKIRESRKEGFELAEKLSSEVLKLTNINKIRLGIARSDYYNRNNRDIIIFTIAFFTFVLLVYLASSIWDLLPLIIICFILYNLYSKIFKEGIKEWKNLIELKNKLLEEQNERPKKNKRN